MGRQPLPHDGSAFMRHEPCPSCGSSDALGRYSDGHGYCHKCSYYDAAEGGAPTASSKPTHSSYKFVPIEGYIPLTARHISQATCSKWGYGYGPYFNPATKQVTQAQVACFFRDGEMVFQKVRLPNKEFAAVGDIKRAGFYGQHLWNRGKKLVVTEGEIDALSVSEVQDNKWPVVSVPNGAHGAKKVFQRELEWLEGFEEVILMFDMDEEGRNASKECAALLSPGKAKIATLPLKDANELLKAGRGREIINAIWDAKEYRPDGIINGAETLDSMLERRRKGCVPYPFKTLNRKTHGIRKGELITITAGTGLGKSTLMRQIAYYLATKRNKRVGYLALEENPAKTAESFVGLHLKRQLHLSTTKDELIAQGWDEELIPEDWLKEMEDEPPTDEEITKAHSEVFSPGNLFLYDHWGSQDPDVLIQKLNYLAKGCDCEYLFLDHISIAVSGLQDGDERRLIDNLMTALRTFVENTGVTLFIISHLTRKSGKGSSHEEGGQVHLSELRGSGAIAQLSDITIAGERDQQSDAEDANITTYRCLKNRDSGDTGVMGQLYYDRRTGWFSDVDASSLTDNPFATPEEGTGAPTKQEEY